MGAKHSVEGRTLDIRVATWNLGNVAPTTGFPFLGVEDEPDIYAIGVQEAVYEPREGFIDMEMDLFLSLHRAVGEDKYDNVWQQSLTPRTDKTYKSKADFLKAYKEHPERMSMSGIRLIVLAKKSLVAEGFALEDVECNVQTCGRLDGISGNKGAVAVTCRIGDIWVSFVSGHLNAHTEGLERRIQDMESINFGLHHHESEFTLSDEYVSTSSETDFQQYCRNVEVPNRSHVVFLFGDLNFRLEPLDADGEPLDHEGQCTAVGEAVDLRQWEELATFDQLLREQAKMRCFYQYTELDGHPKWPPTFKLNTNPDKPGKYNLKRCPSWCDRVLLKTASGGKCVQKRYVAHHDYAPNTSDHVPVTADFSLEVWRTPAHHGHLAAAASAASKLFRSTSIHKERSLEVTNIRLYPNHDFILNVAEDCLEEGEPQEILERSGMIMTFYHPDVPDRLKTSRVVYNEKEIHFPDTIVLKTRAATSDLVRYPVILCVRNIDADKARMHRQGEAMLDLRDLYVKASKGDLKAKLPLSGTHKVEILQQGTPRGFVEFDFTVNSHK